MLHRNLYTSTIKNSRAKGGTVSFKDKNIVITLNRKNLIVLIIIIGLAFFTVTTYVNAMLTFRPSTVSQYEPPPSGGGGRANRNPVADAGPDQRAYVNQTVFFDGSGSSDPDGVIVSYSWSFGDGSHASGVNVTHVYSSEGEYSVVLTVTDDDGATTSDTSIATIEALTPLLRDEVVISAVLVVFIIIFVLGIFLRWWY